jgi:hypothetical protein
MFASLLSDYGSKSNNSSREQQQPQENENPYVQALLYNNNSAPVSISDLEQAVREYHEGEQEDRKDVSTSGTNKRKRDDSPPENPFAETFSLINDRFLPTNDGLENAIRGHSSSGAGDDIPLAQTFWAMGMADIMAHCGAKYLEETERAMIPRRGWHPFAQSNAAASGSEKRKRPDQRETCAGDERVRRIRDMYTCGFKVRIRPGDTPDCFHTITPSEDQLLFMESCLLACLPKIYGEQDWAMHSVRVLDEWGQDRVRYFLMMITARRGGKTYSVGMFNASFLLNVPGKTISVYSTGRRASKMLKELVEKFIRMTGEVNAKRIVCSGQEELFVAATQLGEQKTKRSPEARELALQADTSKLFSYPSNVRGKKNTLLLHLHRYTEYTRTKRVRRCLGLLLHQTVSTIAPWQDNASQSRKRRPREQRRCRVRQCR